MASTVAHDLYEQVAGPISDLWLIPESIDALDEHSHTDDANEFRQISAQFRSYCGQTIQHTLSGRRLSRWDIDRSGNGPDREQLPVEEGELATTEDQISRADGRNV